MGLNPILWAIAGLGIGWLATVVAPAPGGINRIESLAVAVFGAFLGGAFLDGGEGPAAEAFQPASLGLAAAGAVLMLVLLSVMRKAVGPMHKAKARRR